MFSKYRRTNFIPTVNGGDYLEKDIIMNNWDLFKIKRQIRFDMIKRIDIQRPDIFALRTYGTSAYWWIISKYNHIDDWWNDVEVGQDVMLPDIQDIEDFYLKVKARFRK